MKQNVRHIALYILAVLCGSNLMIRAQVVINPGSALTVKDGTALFVGTTLTLRSNSAKSGFLVDQTMGNGVGITGSIAVERYLSANAWHNVSAPLSNANSSLFTGTDLVFRYDETQVLNDWNFGWMWHTGALNAMQGYDVFLPSTITVTYSSANPADLNTGNYDIGVTRTNIADGETESHKGWNLVGNPYPSPVDWLAASGWNKSAINDAKYIWNELSQVYSIFLGGGNPIGLNGGTQFIPSNQGFWVQAMQNGLITINNSARVGQLVATPDYYKASGTDWPTLSLVASGNGFSDETIVRFIAGASDGFDQDLDAAKLFSPSLAVPQLASVMENNFFAINAMDRILPALAVPLYFSANIDGEYTLRVRPVSTIPADVVYVIRDKKLGLSHPLSKDSVLVFNYRTNDDPRRFSLVFEPDQQGITSKASDFSVFSQEGGFTIVHKPGTPVEVNISLYNILGQLVSSDMITMTTTYASKPFLPKGCYIVQLAVGEQRFQHKVNL